MNVSICIFFLKFDAGQWLILIIKLNTLSPVLNGIGLGIDIDGSIPLTGILRRGICQNHGCRASFLLAAASGKKESSRKKNDGKTGILFYMLNHINGCPFLFDCLKENSPLVFADIDGVMQIFYFTRFFFDLNMVNYK